MSKDKFRIVEPDERLPEGDRELVVLRENKKGETSEDSYPVNSADGVPGIPGVGKKKAENMLPPDTTDEGELWAIVKQAYFDYAEKEGINKEEILGTLLVYAHMLWILWEPDKFFIPVDEDEVCQKINSELLNRTKDYLKEIGNS